MPKRSATMYFYFFNVSLLGLLIQVVSFVDYLVDYYVELLAFYDFDFAK